MQYILKIKSKPPGEVIIREQELIGLKYCSSLLVLTDGGSGTSNSAGDIESKSDMPASNTDISDQ